MIAIRNGKAQLHLNTNDQIKDIKKLIKVIFPKDTAKSVMGGWASTVYITAWSNYPGQWKESSESFGLDIITIKKEVDEECIH